MPGERLPARFSLYIRIFVNSSDDKLPEFIEEFTSKSDNSMKTIHLKNGMENALIKKLAE